LDIDGTCVDYRNAPVLQRWNLIPEADIKIFPDYIPKPILDDYAEACLINNLSPKASATLSRRSLQGIITKNKKSHKKLAGRDTLIIELAIKTGMRRSELANLLVEDIDFEHRKIQITGKGDKTRTIPLVKSTALKLQRFCKNKKLQDRVFGLKPACLSNQIRQTAKRGNVDLHAHSFFAALLRHYSC
jgi:integrase